MRSLLSLALLTGAAALVPAAQRRQPLTPRQGFFDNAFQLCGNQSVRRVHLGNDAAVLTPSSSEETAPPRYRAGVASMRTP